MSDNHTIVGSKIKGIRESKNLTVEEIAESSGLSVEQIESIENDQNLPSLGPLIKIARALGVRLGTFMDDNDSLGPVVCRAENRERNSSISFSNGATDARKHMEYHPLAQQKAGRHMEIESSGGITIDTIRDYALQGVDFVSVGALTHSYKSLDMSFKAVKE
jgi:transcriptional regulator with XRE-family HTH domain